jgi:hypothetical protein
MQFSRSTLRYTDMYWLTYCDVRTPVLSCARRCSGTLRHGAGHPEPASPSALGGAVRFGSAVVRRSDRPRQPGMPGATCSASSVREKDTGHQARHGSIDTRCGRRGPRSPLGCDVRRVHQRPSLVQAGIGTIVATPERPRNLGARVKAYLLGHPGTPYCVFCIADALDLSVHSARDATMRVRGSGVRDARGTCTACGKERLVFMAGRSRGKDDR